MTRASSSEDDKLDRPFLDKAAAARAHADPEKAARYDAALARDREQRAARRQAESLKQA